MAAESTRASAAADALSADDAGNGNDDRMAVEDAEQPLAVNVARQEKDVGAGVCVCVCVVVVSVKTLYIHYMYTTECPDPHLLSLIYT